jgi:penicillin amidase
MKRILKRALALLVLIALLAAAAAYWAVGAILHAPLPQVEGTLHAPGLGALVEVLRDKWGIPHIYAQNQHDLLYAQGWVQAQDRWWQMDFYRRVFEGRMSEVAGPSPDAQRVDILMRTLQLKAVAQRDFESLEPELRQYYEAFCEGVNACIASRSPGELALEYRVLGLAGKDLPITPWTPADSLAFGKLMGYVFSGRDLEREPLMAVLEATLSREEWAIWDSPYPYERFPTTIAKEDLPQLQDLPPSAPAPEDPTPAPGPEAPALPIGEQVSVLDLLPQGIPGVATLEASNAWALSAGHTATGAPLFASDPHQGIEMPAMWYELGLHCPAGNGRDALDLYGYASPLLPFVTAGNNAHICWGITNVSGSDALDLFELTVNPENPLQYEWDGAWRDMELREERIAVAGAEPIVLHVRVSHLGPLMPEPLLPGDRKDKHWAICWAGLQEGSIQRAGIELSFARNFEEFRAALRHWDYPAANIAYADVDGNIGFQQAGRFPYGPRHGTRRGPLKATGTADAWTGFIPFDLLPHVLNPRSGMVIAANQPAAPEGYSEHVAAALDSPHNMETAPLRYYGYRAERIHDLLTATPRHDIDSFRRIQTDSAMPVLAAIVHAAVEPLPRSEARQLLLDWRGEMDVDNPAALLAGLFVQRLMPLVFADEIPEKKLLDLDTAQLRALEMLLEHRDGAWFWDNRNTAPVEQADDIIAQALDSAFSEARERFGADPVRWQWGHLHVANFVNTVLGRSGIARLEALMNRTNLPAPGGPASINNARWVENEEGAFEMRTIPSYRRIVDLGNFDNSIAINSTGQSAHPASPHYADQLPLWLRGEYREVNWSREAVKKAAVHRLLLEPK